MTKKHFFVLKGIEPLEIDAKYGFYVPAEKTPLWGIATKPNKTEMRTKITDLSQKNKEQQAFSFLDESKKEHSCILTMINHLDNNILPDKTPIHCFWDRHSFEYRPIGCPIQYVPNRIVKNYYSEITKDNYTLRENISKTQFLQNDEYYKDTNIELHQRNFYVTDGVFCSFNCCLAFIRANHSNPLYAYSENLLSNLYVECFGSSAEPITPAPSWRILKSYGGSISIDEYRKSFYKIDYKDIDNIVFPQIRCKSLGMLFEKQIRI